MSAMQSAARTFTEARDPLNRVRNGRGDDPIVGLAALLAIENAGKGVQKGAKTGKVWKRQSQEHERKERTNVKGQGQVKKGHDVASFVTSGHLGRDCPSRGKGKARSDSSHKLGFSGFAWASTFIEVPMSSGFTSFAMASLWSDCFSGFTGLDGNSRRTPHLWNEGFFRDRHSSRETESAILLANMRSADEQFSRDVFQCLSLLRSLSVCTSAASDKRHPQSWDWT